MLFLNGHKWNSMIKHISTGVAVCFYWLFKDAKLRMFGGETFHVLKGLASFSTICMAAVADFPFHISWKLHPWLVRPHQHFDLFIFSSPQQRMIYYKR